MKEKKRKQTLRKEEISNLSNLSLKYVVGGNEATGTPRSTGRRPKPCGTKIGTGWNVQYRFRCWKNKKDFNSDTSGLEPIQSNIYLSLPRSSYTCRERSSTELNL